MISVTRAEIINEYHLGASHNPPNDGITKIITFCFGTIFKYAAKSIWLMCCTVCHLNQDNENKGRSLMML